MGRQTRENRGKGQEEEPFDEGSQLLVIDGGLAKRGSSSLGAADKGPDLVASRLSLARLMMATRRLLMRITPAF